jgi:hypothetical protein
MSSPDAFQGIETYLRTNWTTTSLVFENEPDPDPLPDYFVFVEIEGTFYTQASIGADPVPDNLWREGGVLFLHVMTRNNIGSLKARTYAKQLADLFRGNEDAGVRPRDMAIGAGEPGRHFPNYFAMTATIDWERDD